MDRKSIQDLALAERDRNLTPEELDIVSGAGPVFKASTITAYGDGSPQENDGNDD